MKKVFFSAVGLVCLIMIIVAADFRSIPGMLSTKERKACVGYTIIEFDKGIDCHGDTIRLIRENGFAERYTGKDPAAAPSQF